MSIHPHGMDSGLRRGDEGSVMGRRSFLGAITAAGFTGIGLTGCTANAPGAATGAVRLGPLGVQLYTVRSLMQANVAQTLAAIAAMGYREVESAGLYGLTPVQFKAELDRAGLVSPAGHHGLGLLRNDLEGTLDMVATLGQRWVVIPSLDQGDRTAEGLRRVSDEFNRYAAAARQRNLRFAYHNHDYEFMRVEGGTTGYDLLLSRTDPALVEMELDIYWAVRGGHDPVALFDQHPGRFPLCHVKDMADMQGARQMAAVGQGEIDFAQIFARARTAGLQHYFVEHDNPQDALASIRASHDFLRERFP